MDRAAFFEQLAGEAEPLAFKPEHEPRLEQLRRRLGGLRGKRVLEPGCGAGPLTVRLAEWVGPEGRVFAFDACAGMTARCAQATAGHTHVEVRQAKAETAVAAPGAWDLVLCFRFYPHLEDAAGFLRRCRDWLAPGGELVVANLEGSAELNAFHAGHAAVRGDRMPSAVELRRQLQATGWRVAAAIDVPDEFFVRARRA